MDTHTNLFPLLTTLFLIGLCSCDAEDVEQPYDQELEVIDSSENPDPGLGEIDSTEPETAEVINDPVRADFNGDGFADLAIGVPNEEVGTDASGAVNVIYGSADGLTTAGNQIWHHDNILPPLATTDDGDLFGHALTVGDFDSDGFADLAIGAPGDDVGVIADAGTVTILYGSAGVGLTAAGAQIFHQDTTDIEGGAEPTDNFGSALASGDFDDDGADDLAIGVPGEAIAGEGIDEAAGAVNVIYGVVGVGLTAAGDQLLFQGGGGLTAGAETPATNDRLGDALAAGDFDEDGNDDLAIGVPGEDRAAANVGVVHVVYGFVGGLSTINSTVGTPDQQLWEQGAAGVPDTAEADDEFGRALAVGDFDRNGADDLAIGVPLEDVSGDEDAGAVNVIYGSDTVGTGLVALANHPQFWHQDVANVEGSTDEGDFFGASLAAGNFDASTRDDLAIGSPGEDLGSDDENAGAVNVLYGTSSSGLSASGDQRWNQDTDGIRENAAEDDAFGSSLFAGDFDDDGATDLAIGVPFEDVPLEGGDEEDDDVEDAGAVNVLYGDEDEGLDSPGDQVWHQNSEDDAGVILGVAEEDDHFGAALVDSPEIDLP